MERIAYMNKSGQSIMENVEPFEFRATIMNEKVQQLRDQVVHRLWVEDGEGGKVVVVWNNAKGYDRDLLRAGHSAYFEGFIRKHGYMDSEGREKFFKEYKAQKISK